MARATHALRYPDSYPDDLRYIDEPDEGAGEVALISRPTPYAAPKPPKSEVALQIEQMMTAMAKLTHQVGGISKDMTKLKGQTLHVTPSVAVPPLLPIQGGATTYAGAVNYARNPRSDPRHEWVEGKPICYDCKMLGHMGKDCPARILRLTGHRAGNGNAPQ